MDIRTAAASQTSFAPRTTRRHPALLSRLLELVPLHCLLALPLGCSIGAGTIASPQQAAQALTSTGTVAPQFFGMVVKDASRQPQLATGSRRLCDASVTWAALEPAPGIFAWQGLDAEVSAAQAGGAAITLTLGMTPTWASSQPGTSSAYGMGATAAPSSLADWDAYVTAVATRYKGRISSYEVWNAPGDSAFWSGPADQLGAQMAALSKHASGALHAADPAALLVAPALSADGLKQFLAAGGSGSIDVLAVATDLSAQAPEAALPQLAAFRQALSGDPSITKPVWVDQSAWKLPSEGLSDSDQAAYTARALLLNASFGIQRLAWYAWDENEATSLRLTDANLQPTAAAQAYATTETWLRDSAVNGCAANAQQLWTCQIVRAGKPAWILWSTAGTVQASSLGMTTVTDLSQAQQPVAVSGLVSVGASPVLLQ